MQLLISAGIIAAIVLWGLISPTSLGAVFDQALSLATKNFGWLYLWVVFGLVVLSAFLAFSRYGEMKLGGEDEEPEFSLLSWFAMLFAAGMGLVWCTGVWLSRCCIIAVRRRVWLRLHRRRQMQPCVMLFSTGDCIHGLFMALSHSQSRIFNFVEVARHW